MKKIFAVLALVGLASPVLAQQAPQPTSSEVAGSEASDYSAAEITGTVVATIATGAVLYSLGGDSSSGDNDAGGGGDNGGGGGGGGTGGTGGTGGGGGTGGTGGTGG